MLWLINALILFFAVRSQASCCSNTLVLGQTNGFDAYHQCVISNCQVMCTGSNEYGQLGSMYSHEFQTFRPVANLTGSFQEVQTSANNGGKGTTCALKSTGDLYCWGYNSDGKVGIAGHDFYHSPQKVLEDVVSYHNGRYVVCAVTSESNLYCWGSNKNHHIDQQKLYSHKQTSPKNMNQYLHGSMKEIKKVWVSDHNTFLQNTSNHIFVKGWNNFGSLGLNTNDRIYKNHFNELPFDSEVASLSVGHSHCALHLNGKISCWGARDFGNTNSWTKEQQESVVLPQEVFSGDRPAIKLSCSSLGCCLLDDHFNVKCQGNSLEFRLGNKVNEDNVFSISDTFFNEVALDISVGAHHHCVAAESGLFCVGSAKNGILGLPFGLYNEYSEVALPDGEVIICESASNYFVIILITMIISALIIIGCMGIMMRYVKISEKAIPKELQAEYCNSEQVALIVDPEQQAKLDKESEENV